MSKEISIASIERILKKMGAERIAENAKRVLRDYIEGYTEKISERIIKATANTKRKTVRVCDVEVVIGE